ncbi:energy-coupling factor transporter ATPase [Evansella sp. AB-P1]|uniref:energy-coupling factor transporter ATPase n=1 Tax=Evansella sp. AB-P1 TaxID=3037653 RepID=UPI00241E040F|nr:energy-coupling factor transporter ATPase [Evansella sp. AB-P1]MDG5788086.1 energy-coupling factor transporter ATPase [Evansella sp. AB-P1]
MGNEIIRINNLSFRYSSNDVDVLKNIHLSIHSGEWVSIVGRNGSGKSTLGKFLNGLLVPTDGHVFIVGLNSCEEKNLLAIRKNVTMVFQNPDNQFIAPTVEDDVAFGLENMGVPYEEMVQRVQEAIHEMDLAGLEKQEPHRLSGGQKQRVAIAGALVMKPSILVFDEATSMLDPAGRMEVLSSIQRLNKDKNITLITITHDMKEAMMADRLIVLKDGKIIRNGKPQDILFDEKVLTEAKLKRPFIYEVINTLREKGIVIPDEIIDEKKLVDMLCKLKRKT